MVALVGLRTSQRLLVVNADTAGRAVADRTTEATFASSTAAVCTVDAEGIVHSVGDGTATVTATVNARKATAIVTVTGSKEPSVPDFRNHIEPVLTRAGCNSGACHGRSPARAG